MDSLLLKSIRDFFTAPILKLAFLPFIITMVVMYALFFVAADYALDALEHTQLQIEQQQTTVENGTTHTEELSVEAEGGSEILRFLLSYSLTSWLLTFLLYTVGSFFVLILSVLIALFIIGFLTPPILRIIQQRHYPDITMEGHGSVLYMLWYFLKSILFTLGIFLLMVPFFFIPLLNVIAINIPFYYFFHKMIVFDVASTLTTKEEYYTIMQKSGNALRLRTLLLYLVSLIPFVALFTAALFVIYIGHSFFRALKDIRPETEFEYIPKEH